MKTSAHNADLEGNKTKKTHSHIIMEKYISKVKKSQCGFYAVLAVFLVLLATSLLFSIYALVTVQQLNVEVKYLRSTVKNLSKSLDDESLFDKILQFEATEDIYPDESGIDDTDMDENADLFNYYEYADDVNDTYLNVFPLDDSSARKMQSLHGDGVFEFFVKPPIRKKRDVNQQANDDNIKYNKIESKVSQKNKISKKESKNRITRDTDFDSVQSQQRSSRIRKAPEVRSGAQWESVEEHTSNQDSTVVRDNEVHPRRRHRQRTGNLESMDERPHTHRNRILPAIQYSGDTSKYVVGHHTNYNGDGHLRHLEQRYVDWAPNSWVKTLNMDQHFVMNDGVLRVKENGLYLIYAQIYYLDEHDTNGYRVYKNSETLLQCTTMTHSPNRLLKANTCYTSGVEYLAEGDQISLEDLADGRYSLFEVGKSFFGLVKLGDTRTK